MRLSMSIQMVRFSCFCGILTPQAVKINSQIAAIPKKQKNAVHLNAQHSSALCFKRFYNTRYTSLCKSGILI